VPYDRNAIKQAVLRHLNSPRPAPDPIYGSGDAGKRIAEAIATAKLTIEKRLTY
jgi:hypothetical protein